MTDGRICQWGFFIFLKIILNDISLKTMYNNPITPNTRPQGGHMNLYLDESGAISPHFTDSFFVIALLCVHDKSTLERAYKRFVSSNYTRLCALDAQKPISKNGKPRKSGSGMFVNGKFKEQIGRASCRERVSA